MRSATFALAVAACSAPPAPRVAPPPAAPPLPSIRSFHWQDRAYFLDDKSVEVKHGEANLRDDMGTLTPVDSAEIAERGLPEIQSMNSYMSLEIAEPQYVDIDGDGREDAVVPRRVIHFEGPKTTTESSLEIYSSGPRDPRDPRVIATIPRGTPWPGMIDSVEVAPGRVDIVWFETGDDPSHPEHHVTWTWRDR